MGNRAYLYLENNQKKQTSVFESNNNLPFFWILILNQDILENSKNHFIENYLYNTEIDDTFKIDNENLEHNITAALSYLNTHYPSLSYKFKQFSKYLIQISTNQRIILDISQIAEFTSANELIKELESIINNLETSSTLNEKDYSEYLKDETYIALIGYDNCNKIQTFTNFCPKYKQEQATNLAPHPIQKNETIQEPKNTLFFSLLALFFLIWLYGYSQDTDKTKNLLDSLLWSIPFFWCLTCKDIITGRGWFSKKQTQANLSKSSIKTLEEVINELPKLNSTKNEGYKELISLCCNETTQKQLAPFFNNLKDFSGNQEYLSTLNYVMDHMYENEQSIIMSLDWKQDLETLEWYIESALKNNFGLEANLPSEDQFEDNISVSHDNVFEEYDKPLRDINFQMGFIDTNSDEYVIIIHKTEDKDKIEKAVNKMGYPYFEK